MIVTPKILARLFAIVIVGVLLQLSFFSEITLFGTSPDIMPALVASLGLLGGSQAGAVSGFSIGLLVDGLIGETLGETSLVLLSVGYLAGLYRERFEVTSSLVPPLLCMGLTLFAEVTFGALQLLLGIDAPVSLLVVRDIIIKTIYAFFLSIPIYIAVRRVLRPALIDEASVRRTSPTMIGA
jgi:rod shape-determining protein MreD